MRVEDDGGRRSYTLTDQGRAYVTENADELSAPWQARTEGGESDDELKPLLGQVAGAVWQISWPWERPSSRPKVVRHWWSSDGSSTGSLLKTTLRRTMAHDSKLSGPAEPSPGERVVGMANA